MTQVSWVIEKDTEGATLVVTGPWSAGAAEALSAGRADGLVLNYARGFQGHTLAFLSPDWNLRRLDVLDRAIIDLQPLDRLAGSLESLSIQVAPGAELDLGPLGHLHTLAGEWDLLRQSMNQVLGLRAITTWEFGPEDLHDFRDHVELTRLIIKHAPQLRSLAPIGDLGELAHLQIQGAHRLEDLSHLTRVADSLTALWLEDCPQLRDIDDVGQLTNLRELGLGDCGPIASFAPVSNLRHLHTLYAWGTTEVLDGDLAPLVELDELREIRMRARRRYHPPLDSFVRDTKRIRE